MDPIIDRKLLQWLESEFPDRMPDPSFSDREILIKMGEVRVVRFIRARLEAQEEIEMEFP